MAPSDELLNESLRLLKPKGVKEEEEELSVVYHQRIEDVTGIELEKAGTEALIMAAQEQA